MVSVKLAPTPEQRATLSDTLHRSIEGADRCSRLARDNPSSLQVNNVLVHQDLKSSDFGARQRSARSRRLLTVCTFDNDTGRKLRVAGGQPYDAHMLSWVSDASAIKSAGSLRVDLGIANVATICDAYGMPVHRQSRPTQESSINDPRSTTPRAAHATLLALCSVQRLHVLQGKEIRCSGRLRRSHLQRVRRARCAAPWTTRRRRTRQATDAAAATAALIGTLTKTQRSHHVTRYRPLDRRRLATRVTTAENSPKGTPTTCSAQPNRNKPI